MKASSALLNTLAFVLGSSATLAQEPPDPFLWLEEVESPAAIEWARVRTERTLSRLTRLPVYDSIRMQRAPSMQSIQATQDQQVERALHGYFDAFVSQNRDSIRSLTTPDFVLIENGYPIGFERFTEIWDTKRPLQERYRFVDLQIQVIDSVAMLRYHLGWYSGERQISWGIETAVARRQNGQWRFAQFHGTWLAPRSALEPAALAEYSGLYGTDASVFRVYVDGGKLYAERANGRGTVAGVRRAELIPNEKDEFTREFDESSLRFERNTAGAVATLVVTRRDGRVIRLPKTGG